MEGGYEWCIGGGLVLEELFPNSNNVNFKITHKLHIMLSDL